MIICKGNSESKINEMKQLFPIKIQLINSISILWFIMFVSFFFQINNAQLESVFNSTTAHTSLITGIIISQDQSFFVTGSLDKNLKIWNTTDYSLKHTAIYSNTVTAINIDSHTNNIYSAISNSDISVIDSTAYSQLDTSGTTSNAYPNSGYANAIQFNLAGSNFYMAGYNGNAALSPKIFKFLASTFASVGTTITTNFASSSSINCMININDVYMAVSSNQNSSFQVQLWDLSANTLFQTLTDCQAQVTSLTYDSTLKWLFVTSFDQTIRIYSLSSITNQYKLVYNIDTSKIGTPYGVSSIIKGYLYTIIDASLVQYTFYPDGSINEQSQTNKWSLLDTGHVMSISPSGSYILVGCKNGNFNVFKFNIYEGNKTILIIIIAGSVGLIVLIIIGIVYIFKCQKKSEKQKQVQKVNNKSIQITQNDINQTVY